MNTGCSSADKPNWFDCGCQCDLLVVDAAGDVQTANDNCNQVQANYIFDADNCGCECGIDMSTGCSNAAFPNWFDCGCQCDRLVNDAAGNI
jgi:hypothetical protein